jgi:hypothetical protein
MAISFEIGLGLKVSRVTHGLTWAMRGHGMQWDGGGGGGGCYAGWGCNVPTWQLCQRGDGLWAGGVADVMDRVAVFLYWSIHFIWPV